jgi:adenylate kinase
LDTISDQINEIRNEIRQRNSTARKVEKIIEGCNTKKSKLCRKIKIASKSKPRIIKIMNESKKNVAKLEKRLPSLTKTGENIRKNFSRINSLVREQAKRKKVSQAKSRRDKSRKAAETRRIQNLARKLATQMLAEKRKAPKKTKAKRKAPKKTMAKRKAPKKTKAKRKAPKKTKAKRKAPKKTKAKRKAPRKRR